MLNEAARQKARTLLFQDVQITFNKDYLKDYRIELTKDRQGFDCEIILIKNITQPMWTKITIEMRLKKDNRYKSIFSYEFNVCDFLGFTGSSSSTNMIILWIQNILKYSKLPKSCPILTGTYGWDHFKVERNSIPSFAMTGIYRINVTNYLKTNSGRLPMSDTTLRAAIRFKTF
ncbi:uncharacterized protein LOC131805802 [Musca domestica]|uniref:Uncharacterized protein LOC131805802 n=1 Tax=Musca domestica TaxID=7370 RepID=A0ABM3VI03_MUSDO|nr:uncharacterized protein LOC131805802 [Musca domestica]